MRGMSLMCVNWNSVSQSYLRLLHTAARLLKWDHHRLPPSLSLSLPDFLTLSLSVSFCLSLSQLSPLYLSHSSLWSMPGACVVGASVFRCVFVSVRLRLWKCYHVYCVSVRQACVRLCVCISDWPCFDLPCSVVFELKSWVWQRLVLKQRGPSADKTRAPGATCSPVKLHSSDSDRPARKLGFYLISRPNTARPTKLFHWREVRRSFG